MYYTVIILPAGLIYCSVTSERILYLNRQAFKGKVGTIHKTSKCKQDFKIIQAKKIK